MKVLNWTQEIFNVAVVAEETVVLHNLKDVPSGFAVLMGIICCVNLEYPQAVKCSFEFLQQVVMKIKPDQASARIHGNRCCFVHLQQSWDLSIKPIKTDRRRSVVMTLLNSALIGEDTDIKADVRSRSSRVNITESTYDRLSDTTVQDVQAHIRHLRSLHLWLENAWPFKLTCQHNIV
ncbi:hypothetical protein MHYP_G00017730 [Metynnis hypsauchen]